MSIDKNDFITYSKNRISNGSTRSKVLIFGFLLLILAAQFLYADNSYVAGSRTLNPVESAAHRASGFFGSLIAAVLGLVLFFIVGPYLMYKSEFQYSAQHFAGSKAADASAPASGSVYLYGKPTLKKSNTCDVLGDTQCLYYNYKKQKLSVTQKVVCGDDADAEGVEKLSPAPDKCRTQVVSQGGQDVEQTICEKCWNANVKEWQTVDEETSTPDFKIGVNTISPNKNTQYKGDLQKKEDSFNKNGTDYKESVSYIEAGDDSVLAVGTASSGTIASGDPFIISTRNFEATKLMIAQEQGTWIWILKILGFIAFAAGMYFVLGPIPALINIAGAIPFLGGIFSGLAGITSGVFLIASVIVAVVMTLVLTVLFKVLRAITDNILVILVLTVIIGLILMAVMGGIFKPPV